MPTERWLCRRLAGKALSCLHSRLPICSSLDILPWWVVQLCVEALGERLEKSEAVQEVMSIVHRVISTIVTCKVNVWGEWHSSSNLKDPHSARTGPSKPTLEKVKEVVPAADTLRCEGHVANRAPRLHTD